MSEYSPGLEGVVAAETAICSITEEGLSYRGYRIADLVDRCTFEEVAFLLLHGELPAAAELAQFRAELAAARPLSEPVARALAALPPTRSPMDALRTAVSLQAHEEPELEDNSRAANIRKSTRLLAQIPALIAAGCRAHGSAVAKRTPVLGDESHAASLLRLLTGRDPDPDAVRVLDASLILYAEHELNASTFAARVVTSTLADLHSGVVAAIGALKGPLHGGANEKAMEMLLEVGSPENAEAWVLERLARHERIMGFGHRVVRQGDSRAVILHRLGANLANARGDTHWLRTAEAVQSVVEREKRLKPNLDFPCAWVYRLLGIPIELYTPVFVASRVAGWAAHVIEQLENNRLMRPRALYVGPEPRPIPPAL